MSNTLEEFITLCKLEGYRYSESLINGTTAIHQLRKDHYQILIRDEWNRYSASFSDGRVPKAVSFFAPPTMEALLSWKEKMESNGWKVIIKELVMTLTLRGYTLEDSSTESYHSYHKNGVSVTIQPTSLGQIIELHSWLGLQSKPML